MFLIHLKGYEVNLGGKKINEKAAESIDLPDCKGVDDLFSRIEVHLSKIPESQRFDLHYPLAVYKVTTNHSNWTGKDFSHQDFIGIDIDNVDYEEIENYHNAVTDVLGCDLYSLGVVKSGSGLHYVIRVPRIESKEYLSVYQNGYSKLCQTVQAALQLRGLPGSVDENVYRDKATLRVPLSDRHDALGVELINRHILPIGFKWESWISTSDQEKILRATEKEYKKTFQVDRYGEISEYPEISLDDMIQGCDFLKFCRDKPGEVGYAQWFAMVSTLAQAKGGEGVIHKWSEKHKDYDERKTQDLISRAKEFGKPRTCDNINKNFPGCLDCPNYKKVKSPALLRPSDWIETEKTGFCKIVFHEKSGTIKHTPQHRDLYEYLKKKRGVIFDKTEIAYEYNGLHWKEVPNFRRFLTNFAEKHFEPKQNSTVREEFAKTVLDCSYDDGIDINKDRKNFINFQNGVYDLDNNKLIEHNRTFLFNYSLGYEYDPKAKCPRYEKFLNEVFAGKKELKETIDLVEEYMAYTLFGMPSDHHKSMLFIGRGSNGKSVLLDLYQSLMHTDQISNVTFSQLSNDNSRSNLINKYANFSDETPQRLNDEAVQQFKTISAGGNFTAKTLYKDIADIRNNFVKFWFSGNHMPKIKDTSYGLLRRLMIVKFENTFDARFKNVDPQLSEKLKQERSGIFNRLLKARDRLLKRNYFAIPAEVDNNTNDLRQYNEPIDDFVTEFFDFDTKHTWQIGYRGLMKLYSLHCKENDNYRPVAKKNFVNSVREYLNGRGYETKKINSGKRIIFEIGINEEFFEDYGMATCKEILENQWTKNEEF